MEGTVDSPIDANEWSDKGRVEQNNESALVSTNEEGQNLHEEDEQFTAEANSGLNNFQSKLPGGLMFFEGMERIVKDGNPHRPIKLPGSGTHVDLDLYKAMKTIKESDFPDVDTARYLEVQELLHARMKEVCAEYGVSPFTKELSERLEEDSKYQELLSENNAFQEEYAKPFYIKLRKLGFSKIELCT